MATKSCHNCRRRRLRCDRSLPTCNKCSTAGQECLGYDKIYQWTNAVASRGRLAGKASFDTHNPTTNGHQNTTKALVRGSRNGTPPTCPAINVDENMVAGLVDPLFQHMDKTARFYLNYYSKRICQELIVHDSLKLQGNPFRQLIAMSTSYPFLQDILVASSAMHYANIMRRVSASKASVDALVDALRARADAIKGLQAVLQRQKFDARHSDEKEALLATVLFFINFALIDSGKGGWRSHMRAARQLIAAQASNFALMPRQLEPDPERMADADEDSSSALVIPNLYLDTAATQQSLQSLRYTCNSIGIRDYVASDSVAYYIWGTTLDSLSNSATGVRRASIIDADEIRHFIDRTEANSYHSCPAQLLLLILRISRLARRVSTNDNALPTVEEMDTFLEFLAEAQAFEIKVWAHWVCAANAHVRAVDEMEINMRTAIASAYQAAVALYVLLSAPGIEEYVGQRQAAMPEVDLYLPPIPTTKDLAATIHYHLSLIPSWYPLFRYTTWPVFMIGVEAVTPESRAWILNRLRVMWEECPWGMMKSAMETLTDIWQLRDGLHATDATDRNWLIQLKNLGHDFLIV
ncbi:hypothetical protein PFICI_14108 [Pestalotiopsis fici W106-1]|uniref:Zn(2)-C6 fungal-type domain-containing protein n=1 Tax=Pestalotiopsis fici (strain W106-1 / CGMCC3.15140) TaxID=1229662 RepID=W3WM79_PESFW|nr:uncharacterized protein PFICI_14108 [Pestalotiopsis fici W106-1]ETS74242.1 hypothetical protein PFICI_14108 [Pestalotiopsis fici W106-1]